MSDHSLTIGQFERFLGQRVRKHYRATLGHNPKKISCKITDTQLTIIIEEAITKLERLLLRSNENLVAAHVRSDLEEAFLPELKTIIQECLDVNVLDIGSIMMDKTGSTAVVAVLSHSPNMEASKRAS